MRSGTTLGERYTLGERLGTGDTGTVWAGHDTIFDQPVTIKILAPALAEDYALRERFRHVALSVADLSIPGVVDVHDCLEERGDDGELLVCHVTERVAGRSLRELLTERGALPSAEALALIAGVARALDAAHGAGVVHGAVKPENLIVDDDGKVTIVDFGFLPPKRSPYTAPELTADSPAADVYGLGAVVYECLTGAAPAANGDISPLLNDFEPADAAPIMKAMSPQANHRFASASAFAAACLHIEPALAEGEEFDPIAMASTYAAELAVVEARVDPAARTADAASEPEPGQAAADEPDQKPAEAAAGVVTEPDTSNVSDGDAGTGASTAAAESAAPEEASKAPHPAEIATTATVAAAAAGSGEFAGAEAEPVPGPQPSDDPPDDEAGEAAAKPRRSLSTQVLVIGVLLAVITLVAGIMHFAVPGQPTGGKPDPEPTSQTSQSQTPSDTPVTDIDRPPNSADPAPTSSSPSPSDAPTSGDDNQVQVPNVIGERRETAESRLSNLGLIVLVSYDSEGRWECRVNNQSPAGGENVPEGSSVTINVRRVNNPQQCIDGTS